MFSTVQLNVEEGAKYKDKTEKKRRGEEKSI